MATIAETLRMLRDVDGVHGSFVIADTGTLIDADLPAIFDHDLLGEIGPRIARLYETFSSGGDEMEACVLRYAEHKLYIRRMTWGIIAILSTVAVNLPALRMVANLAIRRIDPEIAVITSSGGFDEYASNASCFDAHSLRRLRAARAIGKSSLRGSGSNDGKMIGS